MNTLMEISNFANDAAAVEKSLRLAQSLAQVGASIQTVATDAAPYVLARGQFNISRRFLRVFKWVDNYHAALATIAGPKSGLPKLFETAKFSFLAVYFFMEMLTITDVLGLTNLEWGPWLVLESARFWFYALAASLALSLWEGLFVVEKQQRLVTETKEKRGKKESTERKVVSVGRKRGLPYKQIAMDSFDLFIPGAVVGWMPFSPLTVGIAMAISTLLQLSDMWPKVQAKAAAASGKPKKS